MYGYTFDISTFTTNLGLPCEVEDSVQGATYLRVVTCLDKGLEVREKIVIETVDSMTAQRFNPKKDLLKIKSIHLERRRGSIGSDFSQKPVLIRKIRCEKLLLSS